MSRGHQRLQAGDPGRQGRYGLGCASGSRQGLAVSLHHVEVLGVSAIRPVHAHIFLHLAGMNPACLKTATCGRPVRLHLSVLSRTEKRTGALMPCSMRALKACHHPGAPRSWRTLGLVETPLRGKVRDICTPCLDLSAVRQVSTCEEADEGHPAGRGQVGHALFWACSCAGVRLRIIVFSLCVLPSVARIAPGPREGRGRGLWCWLMSQRLLEAPRGLGGGSDGWAPVSAGEAEAPPSAGEGLGAGPSPQVLCWEVDPSLKCLWGGATGAEGGTPPFKCWWEWDPALQVH